MRLSPACWAHARCCCCCSCDINALLLLLQLRHQCTAAAAAAAAAAATSMHCCCCCCDINALLLLLLLLLLVPSVHGSHAVDGAGAQCTGAADAISTLKPCFCCCFCCWALSPKARQLAQCVPKPDAHTHGAPRAGIWCAMDVAAPEERQQTAGSPQLRSGRGVEMWALMWFNSEPALAGSLAVNITKHRRAWHC